MLRSRRSRSTSAAGVSKSRRPEPGAIAKNGILNITKDARAGRIGLPTVSLYRNPISDSDNAITSQASPRLRPHRQPRPPPPAPPRRRGADLRPRDDRGAAPTRLLALRWHDVPDPAPARGGRSAPLDGRAGPRRPPPPHVPAHARRAASAACRKEQGPRAVRRIVRACVAQRHDAHTFGTRCILERRLTHESRPIRAATPGDRHGPDPRDVAGRRPGDAPDAS